MTGFRPLLGLCAAALIALAGCESAEDRAERHFQTALELVAAGDIDRAMVAFSNVFRHDGFHRAARESYAALLVELGDTTQAYSQYLRLVEQYPDSPDARRILAELAVARGDWDEVERHGRAAMELTPGAPAVQAIGLALDYRAALLERDEAARSAVADRAEALLAALPDNAVLRQVVIDSRMAREDAAGALVLVEQALAGDDTDFGLHRMKLNLLARLGDDAGVGTQLQAMFARCPEREDVRATLIDWHLGRGDTAGAEAFLREVAGDPATGDPMAHGTVVQFLGTTQGIAAARDELDRLIAAAGEHPNADAFRSMLAEIDFTAGETGPAIAALEAVLAAAEPGEQTRRIRVTLARMLDVTGQDEAAAAAIETVLAEDPTHVEALRLRAARAILRDRPEAAIIDLRAALGQEPRDAGLLTLMAQAHERNGARELAGEMLSRAVEASDRGAMESLRYARFLQRAGRMAAAEGVLTDALQANRGEVTLLEALADLHLSNRDGARVREVVETLRQIGTPAARRSAEQLEASLLVSEGSLDEGIALLEEMVERSEGDITVTAAAVMQGHLRAGRPEAARSYIDALLAERTEPLLRMLGAGLHLAMAEIAEAEAELRALMAEAPDFEAAPQMLYGLLRDTGRDDEARSMLEAALARQPESDTLLGLMAEDRLRADDYEGAIAVYERLYARNPDNVALANNLASLLTSFRSDAESLERGHTIARRLRGIPVPAFQDTYGWIEYRRGNHAEALAHLEPAAAALPDEPLVLVHLGMTYAALERTDEAIAVLGRALELAGDSPLPQFAEARARLGTLMGN